jgi:PAS domain S-box-containing protein
MKYVEAGLQSTDITLYVVDSHHRFLYLNPQAEQTMGISSKDATGRTGLEVGFENEQVEVLRKATEEVMRSGKAQHTEVQMKFKGEVRILEQLALPVHIADEGVAAVTVFLQDRTVQAQEMKVFEALAKVNDILRTAEDTAGLVTKVVRAVAGSLHEEGFAVLIQRGGRWISHYAFDLKGNDELEIMLEATKLAENTIASSKPLNIPDALVSGLVNKKVAKKYGLRSVLALPVEIEKGTMAVLLFGRVTVTPFSDTEVALAKKIGSTLAVAFHDQLLLERIKESDRDKECLVTNLAMESEKLTQILNGTPVAIALFEGSDVDATLVQCNNLFRDTVISAAPRPLEGKRYDQLATHEEVEITKKVVKQAMSTGKMQVIADHFHQTERGGGHCKFAIQPLAMDSPSFLLVATSTAELVESKRKIEELATQAESERARLRAMIDNLPVGILLVDASGNIVESNNYRRELWGGEAPSTNLPGGLKRFKGRWANTGMSIPVDGWPIMRALKKGEYIKGEMIDITYSDGKQGTELVSAAPIYNASGEKIGAVAIVLDLADQRKLEHNAIEAKELMETYLDLMTQDVDGHNAKIANHIRSAIADGKPGKGELLKALQTVALSSELISTVRKLQQVESNELAYDTVELTSLLDFAIADVKPMAGPKAEFDHPPHQECFVHASPLLKEVFVTILSHAIRRSDGDVHIAVRQNRCFDGGKEYQKVTLEDDAPGISNEDKLHLFMRKYRGQGKSHENGLRLYLAKRLVEEHSGKMWVEDRVPGEIEKGARFIIHLPAMTDASSQMLPPDQTEGHTL